MIIYIDIDETICITPDDRDYAKVTPITANIDKANKLYDEGNTIVYWTARGTLSNIDWYDVTKNQLLLWNAKHNELILGKPYFDLYICDKSMNVKDWK